MSVGMPNVVSAAPPSVPVLCPSLGLDVPSRNPESTVGLHREFLGDGDGRVPSGSRIPFPLVQGYASGRDDRSALSSAAQVPPVVTEALARVSVYVSDVSEGVQVPPAVAEDPVIVVSSGSAGCCGGSGDCC